jgi:hypothetical protein
MHKNTLLLFLIIVITYSCNKDDFSCYPEELKENIIASYTFSKGSLDDISGNGNHLNTLIGTNTTNGRSGNPNCAYEFDYLESPYQKILKEDASFLDGMESFSISLWIKVSRKRSGAGFIEGLISRDTFPTCPDRFGQWSLSLYDCRRAVFAQNNSAWADWLSPNILDCSGEIPENLSPEWINLIGIKNIDSYSIYLNGILEQKVDGNASCSSNPDFLSKDEGPLVLGYKYSGTLDDVIIFDRALSDEEVKQVYKLESCCN